MSKAGKPRIKIETGGKGRAVAPVPGDATAPHEGFDRRSKSRRATGYNASCVVRTLNYNVEVVDLSQKGARVRVRQGLMPAVGQALSLALMDGKAIEAFVVWSDAIEIGLQFVEPMSDPSEALHFDELGSDFYRAVLKLQIAKE